MTACLIGILLLKLERREGIGGRSPPIQDRPDKGMRTQSTSFQNVPKTSVPSQMLLNNISLIHLNIFFWL